MSGANAQAPSRRPTTYRLDGRDYPSMGNLDFDSLSGLQVDANTVEFTLKRAGRAIGRTRRAVSKDGRTLTISHVLTTRTAFKLRHSRV